MRARVRRAPPFKAPSLPRFAGSRRGEGGGRQGWSGREVAARRALRANLSPGSLHLPVPRGWRLRPSNLTVPVRRCPSLRARVRRAPPFKALPHFAGSRRGVWRAEGGRRQGRSGREEATRRALRANQSPGSTRSPVPTCGTRALHQRACLPSAAGGPRPTLRPAPCGRKTPRRHLERRAFPPTVRAAEGRSPPQPPRRRATPELSRRRAPTKHARGCKRLRGSSQAPSTQARAARGAGAEASASAEAAEASHALSAQARAAQGRRARDCERKGGRRAAAKRPRKGSSRRAAASARAPKRNAPAQKRGQAPRRGQLEARARGSQRTGVRETSAATAALSRRQAPEERQLKAAAATASASVENQRRCKGLALDAGLLARAPRRETR